MDIPFIHFSGMLRLIPAVKEQVSFPPDGKDIVGNAQTVNLNITMHTCTNVLQGYTSVTFIKKNSAAIQVVSNSTGLS